MFTKILRGVATSLFTSTQGSTEAEDALREKVQDLQKALEKKEAELEKKEGRDGFQPLNVGDVKTFDGNQSNWIKWKAETEGVLHGKGFQKVMQSRKEADKDPNTNLVLYSTLSAATCRGTAFSKVYRFKGENDGHAAWKKLLEWYESETCLESHADTLRLKLRNIKLYDGGNISDYINRFEFVYYELHRIPKFGIHEAEAKGIFVRNIMDSSLYYTHKTMLRSKANRSIEELILDLRKVEEELERQNISNRAEVKRRQEPIFFSGKRRRVEGEVSLTVSVLHPNLIGIIRIPPETWRGLKKEHRKYVLQYNTAVRHKVQAEEYPVPIDGITIGEQKDDGMGNTDVPRRFGGGKQRRVHRVMLDTEETASHPSSRR